MHLFDPLLRRRPSVGCRARLAYLPVLQAPGIVSKLAAFSRRGVHGSADLVKTSAFGSSHDASSSVPAFTHTTSGWASTALKIGDPQPEQKCRRVVPWWTSPVVSNDASVSPSTMNASRCTPTTTEKAVPVWRWQSLQWQTACANGSDSRR